MDKVFEEMGITFISKCKMSLSAFCRYRPGWSINWWLRFRQVYKFSRMVQQVARSTTATGSVGVVWRPLPGEQQAMLSASTSITNLLVYYEKRTRFGPLPAATSCFAIQSFYASCALFTIHLLSLGESKKCQRDRVERSTL